MTLFHRLRPALLATVLVAGRSGIASAQSQGFSKDETPFATISRMLLKQPARDSLVELARSQVGVKYKLGAISPGKAFDCSGLVQWLLGKFDLSVPRASKEQAKQGIAIPKDPDLLQPGDLLFFGRGKTVSHVGIYVGEGRYVEAANRRVGVVESDLPTGKAASTWWKGARRVFADDSAALPVDSSHSAARKIIL